MIGRRTALGILASAPVVAACRRSDPAPVAGESTMSSTTKGTAPAIFLAHGAPPLLDDALWMRELRDWAGSMPRPTSILMISAHWEKNPVTLGATQTVPLIYDFYGFPQKYYETTYPAPGAPRLAARVTELLGGTPAVHQAADRGLDHGAYIPLVAMYPSADIPVLQMSLPTMEPKALMAVGRALAPLRNEGVLIIGSGFLVHNLRAIDFSSTTSPAWASEFDDWAAHALAKRDVDALAQYRKVAPGVDMALPTHEHFVPVLVALGASLDRTEPVSFPITGTWLGGLTKRSVQFG
jgi:4,5-DOPA dioxygenase extradiol